MDKDIAGDVDFDFFDSPRKSVTPEVNSKVKHDRHSHDSENVKSVHVNKTAETEHVEILDQEKHVFESKHTDYWKETVIKHDTVYSDRGGFKNSTTVPIVVTVPVVVHKEKTLSDSLSESEYSSDFDDSGSNTSSNLSKLERPVSRSKTRQETNTSARKHNNRSRSRSDSSFTSGSSRSREVRSGSSSSESDTPRTPRNKILQKSRNEKSNQVSILKSSASGDALQKQQYDKYSNKQDIVKESRDLQNALSSVNIVENKTKKYESDASSRSGGESDSDMTDVSPLTSPRNGINKGKIQHSRSAGIKYKPIPLDMHDDYDGHVEEDRNRDIDLNCLMKALCDNEKEKRVRANTRRVMFEAPNYTFTNDRAIVIDNENQRLLQQIMKNVTSKNSESNVCRKGLYTPPQRMTSSAVNRVKEQKRIEMDNFAMLRRLNKIKPTRGMARNDQMKEFEKTTCYGVTLPPGSQSGRLSSSYLQSPGLFHRSRSMSSVHSASTTASLRSTMSSASRKAPVDRRPKWCAKW